MMGEIKKMADVIDYQSGSVVSKTIIKKETGTVTLFAFAEGEGLSEHTAPHEAMAYLLEGEAEVSIAGNSFHLKQGDMIILPADKPHALKATKKFKMLLVMIRS